MQRVDRMVELLRDLKGAGLAAPQVGWSAAAAVIEVRRTAAFRERPESPLIVLINPVVNTMSDEIDVDWEGCFSVPGLMGRVPRPRHVEVTFIDRAGDERVEQFSGYVARVVQHELDHLDNKVFLDRMPSMDTLSTIENWQRFGKELG